jgi:hypothetical protein
MDLDQILPSGFFAAQTALDQLIVRVQERSQNLTRL